MGREATLCHSTICQLALDMSHCLASQEGWVDGGTAAAQCRDKALALSSKLRHRMRMPLCRLNPRAYHVYEPKPECSCCVQSRVLQVNMLGVGSKGEGEEP